MAEAATGSTVRRLPWWHLAPIGLLLVMSSYFVGHDGYVFIDEAALLAQVELVADGSWTADRPLADVDPAGAYAPMARSTRTDDGFAPYPNHPLHVLVATAASEVAGDVGVRLLSVLGVLGAAAAAGALAAARSRRHSAVAMWVTGLASPLVFDANLVLGHALASALTGAALVLTFVVSPRLRSPGALAGLALAVAALVAAGALLRSEVVLLGGVIGIVSGAHALRDRTRNGIVVGIAAASAAVAVYVVEPWWIQHVVGSSPGQKVIAASSRGGVSGALDGAMTVLFGLAEAGMWASLAGLFAIAAVVILRMRPADPGLAAVLAGGAVVAAVATVADPNIIPGIVWAFPLLGVGLAAASRRQQWPEPIRRSAEAAVVFAVLVLSTQYAVGGGAEWGWRYVAVALPAVGAALSLPLIDLAAHRAVAARLALGAVVLVGALVPFSGIVAQRRTSARVELLLERTDAAVDTTGADVIVAADPSFGRYAWHRSIAGDVVTARGEDRGMEDLLDHLDDRGVDRILLVWVGTEPSLPDDDARRDGPVLTLLAGAYAARAYSL